jgi:hypothetical protein
LDNVLRDYLIPRVVEILNPVSDYAFAFQTLEKRREEGRPTPPVSTRAGVARYEAWRLPPAAEGAKGFVSVAIVADMTGYADTLGRIDKQIENWRNSLE